MNNSFIQINNISKHFVNVKAVDDVSFEIKEGEFFSLLGPSGCGKTTLLRLLAGFEYPTSGTLLIDGIDITALPPNKRPTNMVFQNYAIFPHLNVEKNIQFGLRKLGLSNDEIEKRVKDVLTLVKLEGYEERFSNQLSGGQRQRVALARALVRQPKVLLLDEPLGALDKKLRDEMQLELRALQKNIGITFIFVTHDQQEAISMSDRVAVMNNGKIQQLSAPNELYKNPENIFVSDFIGETNFLQAETKSIDGNFINVSIEKLGEFKISGVQRAKRGEPKVEVTFSLDSNGILAVTANDKVTGAQANAEIKADRGRLTDSDIERMIADAERYREEDMALARKINLRNALEETVYGLKSSMTEKNDIAGISELDETLEFLEFNSESASYEELQKEADKLFSKFGARVEARKLDM